MARVRIASCKDRAIAITSDTTKAKAHPMRCARVEAETFAVAGSGLRRGTGASAGCSIVVCMVGRDVRDAAGLLKSPSEDFFQNQYLENNAINEIARPKPARFLRDAPKPFEPGALHP